MKNKLRTEQQLKSVDSLESTRRILSMMEEFNEMEIRSLKPLCDQNEVLDRIEEGMGRNNADMREEEKNLSGMEKYYGISVLPCNKIILKDDWKANNMESELVNPNKKIETINAKDDSNYMRIDGVNQVSKFNDQL
ncbi:synaptosomal-associated protein 25-like [Drosophila sulfurigaster albostrigata]|uniref:synaptosomal-associated protein 25-like n=1 Tax=Drosophila sulfurigaster albostrigata TaxID=89887 RepID=UPI002D218F2E|nr:synaptosomal-associated protein 25-like [Drosophila sulfurigaster albostrigata]